MLDFSRTNLGGGEKMTMVDQANPLKRLRDEVMLTQKELAKLAGVSPSTVFNIENGGRARGRTLRKLANALDVEPRELASLKGER
jgi:transcriptional regulator with XRE-family HTH domain